MFPTPPPPPHPRPDVAVNCGIAFSCSSVHSVVVIIVHGTFCSFLFTCRQHFFHGARITFETVFVNELHFFGDERALTKGKSG